MFIATLIRVAIILKCAFQKAKKLLYCAYLKSWFVRVSVNPCFHSVRFEPSGSKCCAANYLQLLKSDYPQLNKEKSVGLFKI